jgi:hypothetical protein
MASRERQRPESSPIVNAETLPHKTLEAALFAAYGWDANMPDGALPAKLSALNLERAAGTAFSNGPSC